MLGDTRRRFDGFDYYAQKFMTNHRLAKHRRNIWADFIDGADMQALSLVSPHACVFVSQKVGKSTSDANVRTSNMVGVLASTRLA